MRKRARLPRRLRLLVLRRPLLVKRRPPRLARRGRAGVPAPLEMPRTQRPPLRFVVRPSPPAAAGLAVAARLDGVREVGLPLATVYVGGAAEPRPARTCPRPFHVVSAKAVTDAVRPPHSRLVKGREEGPSV